MNSFNKVYPFTTENIDGYFKLLDLDGSDVLTVGSSLDQAFNAIYYGCKNVTVVDISPNVEDYYKLKKDILLNSNYDNFYRNILNNLDNYRKDELFSYNALKKMNTYMQSENNFETLKSKLKNKDIEIVNDDIFKLDNIKNKKFDRIIFSNILQYLSEFSIIYNYDNKYSFLEDKFKLWQNILNDNGILQLIYYYNFDYSNKQLLADYNTLRSILNYDVLLERFDNIYNNKDAVLTYKKTRK